MKWIYVTFNYAIKKFHLMRPPKMTTEKKAFKYNRRLPVHNTYDYTVYITILITLKWFMP